MCDLLVVPLYGCFVIGSKQGFLGSGHISASLLWQASGRDPDTKSKQDAFEGPEGHDKFE